MMEYKEAVLRLECHAGSPAGKEMPDSKKGLSFLLYEATRDETPANFDWCVRDIIACLEVANIEQNGPVPSVRRGPPERPLDHTLAWSVACIIAEAQRYALIWDQKSLFEAAYRTRLRRAALVISMVWTSLMDSDIDDLYEEVWYDLSGNGIPNWDE